MLKKFSVFCATLLLAGAASAGEDLLSFGLNCNNGVFTPKVLQVPAGKKFKLEIHNVGTEAIEFESKQLRKEKALSPGGTSFVVIYPLQPGEYKYFDDFHISVGQGSIVAQ
ncbi:MAG: cupredoxin domain-containing protein [Glaciimonas sp.]|nr:cupredoxin domain-containing protein [Glaciimonas sp.]NMM36543.1 cupredoxin domain-containing protein [Glaciimonas sp.]